MRIILKPLGVAVVIGAMGILTVIAVRGRQQAVAVGMPLVPVESTMVAPVAVANTADAIVYDDALRNGWEDFSWAKHDPAYTKQSAPGKCIRVESKKFEAVAFHHAPMSVDPYDRVTFRIHGGEKGGQRLKLVAQYGKDKEVKNGSEHLLPALTPGEWETITVPLTELGVADKTNVVGFWMQEGHGETLSPYFVDDVRFLRPGETARDL